MKIKTLHFVILLLCIVMILPSCDITNSQEGGTESEAISIEMKTEKQTEKQTEEVEESKTSDTVSGSHTEWETIGYPDIDDNKPDLENVDYSKLSFCSEISTYLADLQLTVSKIPDVRIMKELVEAKQNEWKQVTSYEEGLELLEGIVADSKSTECAIMLIIDYTAFPDIYAVDTRWKQWIEFEFNGGEKQIVIFYSKEWIEDGFTPSPEELMEAFERYTRYSKVTSVVVSAVPVIAE